MIKPISGDDKALITTRYDPFRMPKKALSQHGMQSSKTTFTLYR